VARASWLTLFFAAAGCGNTATIDQVLDLRELALKAEPPDQVVAYSWGDAGVFPPVAPVSVTALIADPRGGGRSIHFAFSTCAHVDSQTQQCHPGTPDFTLLAESDIVPVGGPGAEVAATFTPSQQLLRDALDLDAYHGFGYLPLPVQLSISANSPDGGIEEVVGVKQITFTQTLTSPPQAPNHNPVISEILLNDAGWPEAPPQDLPVPSDGSALMTPVPQPALWESFSAPKFAGGLQELTEVWNYAFYCTAGQFAQPTSGGTFNFGGNGNGGPPPGVGGNFAVGNGPPADNEVQSTGNTWKPGASDGGPVTFWIVVLDGRGGCDWTTRIVNYVAP
jgi:hypothetical protein